MNSSRQRMPVTMFAGSASIAHGRFVFGQNHQGNELTSWVSIRPGRFTLQPRQSIDTRATIRVPRRASHGERYGVIWAETASTRREIPGSIRLVSRVGVRMYIDVGPGGEPVSNFAVSDLRAVRGKGGRPVLAARVRNTGERALDIGGTLVLSGGPGALRAGPFRIQSVETLAPGDSARVRFPVTRTLPDGPWRATLRLASGRVERTVHGRLTFPDQAGESTTMEMASRLNARQLSIAGAVMIAVALMIFALLVRSRRRMRSGRHRA
ncbi:MAG: hypothetical protein WCA46_12025 [Actinocatenispora sp.]